MQTPLFELFRTINSHYIYDTNKNQIYPISEACSDILSQVKRGELSVQEAGAKSDEIKDLCARGLLSDNRVETLEHPYTPLLHPLLNRRIQKVTLQLTQNCNFRCSYCHYTSNTGNQRLHANRKMPLDMAKDAILFLREHSVDTPEVYIGFYGGEPLLEFDMLEELVLFAEKELAGKKINYTLTTNAVLLTDRIIEFFIQHQIDILISLDGSKESHDKNRVFAATGKGTFDSIIHKMQEISVKYPDYFKKITINMVMDPSVDFDIYSALFEQYPFMKRVHVMSTIIDDLDSEVKNVYTEAFTSKNRYQTFLSYLNAFERMPSNQCSPALLSQSSALREVKFVVYERESLSQKIVPSGPCVPGEVRLMVTVEGKFILCERVSEVSEPMCIGNIKDGLDFEKIYNLLNVAQTTAEHCRDCWAFSLCNLCVKYSDKDNTLCASTRLSHCNTSKTHAIDTLRKAAMIRELTEYYGYSPIV